MGSKKNDLFGSSRFVLPEHRELYMRIKEQESRYVPPELDSEQLAELSEQIWQAYQSGGTLTLSYYDGKEPSRLSGHVMHIDQAQQRIKLRTGSGMHWLSFASLLQAECGDR